MNDSDEYCLLGCYTVQSGEILPTFGIKALHPSPRSQSKT
jgi:hypothetical protein